MLRERRDIVFRPVAETDLPMLDEWMHQPHWLQWWGDPGEELDHIRDMIEGRDTTRPYIFEVDGKPAGYIQVWFIGDHQNEKWIADNPWLAELPADFVGVDLSIGEAANLSQGMGSSVLNAFVGKLVGEGYRNITIDPDPENIRAVRAYEKAGFRPIPHLEGRTQGVLLMQYQLEERQS